jgi:glutaredoxin
MFEIISLEGCPHSQEAERLFQEMLPSAAYQVRRVDMRTKQAYQKGSYTTFPQISFVVNSPTKGKQRIFIGGCDDMKALVGVVQDLKDKHYDAKIIFPMMKLFAARK